MVRGEVVDGGWGDVKVGGSWIEGVLVKGEKKKVWPITWGSRREKVS